MEESPHIAVDDATATRLEMGKRIRLRRQQLGLSVADLAEGLSVSRESVYGYESGSRAINSYDLPRLGQLLRVLISYLFGEFILYGTGTEKVGTWAHPNQYPSARRFPSEQTSVVLSEAEIEVVGIMRGLSPVGQDYLQAFTRMVQERETSGRRKMDSEPDANGGHQTTEQQPTEPGDDAQNE